MACVDQNGEKLFMPEVSHTCFLFFFLTLFNSEEHCSVLNKVKSTLSDKCSVVAFIISDNS